MVGGDEIVGIVVLTFGLGFFEFFCEFAVSTTVALMNEHGG
jgi:hypothetical protein